MSPTRRLFLQGVAAFAFATGLPLTSLSQEQRNNQSTTFDPENLAIFSGVSPRTFEQWIGSRFRVNLNDQARGALVLVSVQEFKKQKLPAQRSRAVVSATGLTFTPSKVPDVLSFSLQFQRAGSPLPQNTYTLDHDWLGRFPLFLVPYGLTGPASTCTAVFSLLNQPTTVQ